MSYTFETNFLGLTVSVEGTFSPAEPQTLNYPGCAPSFEVESIEHEGKAFDLCEFDSATIDEFEGIAFDKASDEAEEQSCQKQT